MAIQVVMPQLGITTLEGTITRWLKNEGDAVSKSEPLFEIATDKVNMVVESLGEGILRRIIVPAGGTAKVTEAVAIIAAADEDIAALLPAAEPAQTAPAPAAPAAGETAAPAPAREPSHPAGRTKVSPLARRVAQAEGISAGSLAAIAGSGIEGAVVKADVLKYAAEQKGKEQAASALRPSTAAEAEAIDKVIPLTPMRKTIAERMSLSTREAPQFWLGSEARLAAVIEWRKTLNERLAGKGAGLTYTDFFIKAAALALRDCPYMNASYTPEGIAVKANCNIGVAVAIDEGLIVPVIRNADKLSLAEVAAARTLLIEKAKNGRLSPEEFSGGTFTISNLGMFCVDQFVAIVNPPEAGILSVGRIKESLELCDGNVVSVPKVAFGLSIDHRCVDGAQGARFLQNFVERIEDPFRLLL